MTFKNLLLPWLRVLERGRGGGGSDQRMAVYREEEEEEGGRRKGRPSCLSRYMPKRRHFRAEIRKKGKRRGEILYSRSFKRAGNNRALLCKIALLKVIKSLLILLPIFFVYVGDDDNRGSVLLLLPRCGVQQIDDDIGRTLEI